MFTYVDEYISGYDQNNDPIYDHRMGHTRLVARARKEAELAAGCNKVTLLSIDYYADDPMGELPFVCVTKWRFGSDPAEV